MANISFTSEGIVVDADLIGGKFGVEPQSVPELMRSGAMTSRTETGEGEDAGRHRLTFFYRGRALRLTVDASGEVLTTAMLDMPDRSEHAG